MQVADLLPMFESHGGAVVEDCLTAWILEDIRMYLPIWVEYTKLFMK